jgi:hypothetical protein
MRATRRHPIRERSVKDRSRSRYHRFELAITYFPLTRMIAPARINTPIRNKTSRLSCSLWCLSRCRTSFLNCDGMDMISTGSPERPTRYARIRSSQPSAYASGPYPWHNETSFLLKFALDGKNVADAGDRHAYTSAGSTNIIALITCFALYRTRRGNPCDAKQNQNLVENFLCTDFRKWHSLLHERVGAFKTFPFRLPSQF